MTEKQRQEIVNELNKLTDKDPDAAHGIADGLLLMALGFLGYSDITQAYRKAKTRVGFWYS